MWVTNAAAGGEHGLAFRVFGSECGLEWHQEQPNELRHRRLGGWEQLLTRRLHGALHPAAERVARVEIGHTERPFEKLVPGSVWGGARDEAGRLCWPFRRGASPSWRHACGRLRAGPSSAISVPGRP
jgi:hypothetical protein